MDSSRPLAVVTGESSGIGLELAKQFAAHDFDLIIAASKAFVQSFALVLRAELGDTRVTVTSLLPGPIETEFFGGYVVTTGRSAAGAGAG